jgi:hypothetical protein
MKKYYKIVSTIDLFTETYGISDVKSIPEGSRFVAHKMYDYGYDAASYAIDADKPMLHFCYGAFDTMLWWPLFNKMPYVYALSAKAPTIQSCVYEIVPITPVIKSRAQNEDEFYRCGANTIEFKKQIPIEQIAQLAIQEYERGKLRKYLTYGRDYVKEQVNFWQKEYK